MYPDDRFTKGIYNIRKNIYMTRFFREFFHLQKMSICNWKLK